jgi:outer membrane receptor for ferrienterochelin and colicins
MVKTFIYSVLLIVLNFSQLFGQNNYVVNGKVVNEDNNPLSFALVAINNTNQTCLTDSLGFFKIEGIKSNRFFLKASAVGYKPMVKEITLLNDELADILFVLQKTTSTTLNDVVVSGTLKPVSKLESPVPVEVYTPTFFKKNPTPNIFEALQNINGVRPQLNCNICNTGDIHINGLEGPYTMILIDGMPIVSSLSTVYGLSGIPNSLIERIEIVKGPASSLYGSEAVGGLINIITKSPQNAPKFSADIFSTSWAETNTDIGFKFNLSEKLDFLTGLNYFRFNDIYDLNNDNFTDVTLQNRISIFQKVNVNRKANRLFTFAGRYNYEDRWGGDVKWTPQFRGGSQIYGESIYTSRWELFGNYQLPVAKENLILSFSYNNHNQNSVYGSTIYQAKQNVAFSQLVWDKNINNHSLLFGSALRYTFYDDNTTATQNQTDSINKPDQTYLPGLFVQDEIAFNPKQKLLLGFRYEYNSNHGNIFTPRLAYKYNINANNILRFNAGTGFRVVNLFTEDHAALTGAREVIVVQDLKPEKSYNANINFVKKIFDKGGNLFNVDASLFYTYFTNRIIADYDFNPNQIVYNNLQGSATSRGFTFNLEANFVNGLSILTGATLQNVFKLEDDGFGNEIKTDQILTEKWMGTWAVSYPITKWNLSLDYTGNVYGPMRLPLLGNLDPRSEFSPVWSIQNLQITKKIKNKLEVYGGVKNFLNFTPGKNDPFLIARTNDPFDEQVQYKPNGEIIASSDNPHALSFDPTYVYAPNQGIRGFLGVRYTIN